MLKIARCLFIIYQMVDGGMIAADGARRALLHVDGTELHGLGIEGQQAVGQQLTDTRKVFQRLSSLDGTQHTSDGTQYASLRTRWYGTYGRRLFEEATIAGCAWQMGKRLAVEAQNATVREWLARHHTRIINQELHGEVVGTVHDEVVLLDDVQCVR